MRRILRKVAVSFMLMLAFSGSYASRSEDIYTAIKSLDEIAFINLINQIKKEGGNQDDYQILIGAWNVDDARFRNKELIFLRKDIIRSAIGDALLQAANNGLIPIERKEIYGYALSILSTHKNISRAHQQAMMIIAHYDKKDDADLLEKYLRGGSDELFDYALSAIVIMCNSKVVPLLENVLSKTRSQKRKAALYDMVRLRRKILDSGYCEGMPPKQQH